jgi:hypothetical protein
MLARLTTLLTTLSPTRWRMVGALALVVLALAGLWLQEPVAPPRFEVLTGGQEVKDHRTGLVWRRCAEGQWWDGQHCDGEARTVPHLAALALAQSQPGWRLPTLPELYSLVEPGRRHPALDAAVFPDTPGYWFWSSTLTDSRISHAWLVHFGEGQPNFALRMNHVHVRLVRP